MYPPSHPNTILKRVIEESGSATLVEDRPQPQPFGSAWSIIGSQQLPRDWCGTVGNLGHSYRGNGPGRVQLFIAA
jgi:hypothetical protein